MRKVVILFSMWVVLSVGLLIIQSCDSCNDGSINYKLTSITGEVKRITGIEILRSYQTVYYTVEPLVPQANGVRYDSIGFDIINDIEFITYKQNFNFFNTALACDPAVNYELLADMTITSSADYVDGYPAGTDLSEIISIREGYQLHGIPIPTYLSNAELRQENLFLTFEYPPSQSKVHNITILYKLYDGREYEIVIQGLKING